MLLGLLKLPMQFSKISDVTVDGNKPDQIKLINIDIE